MSKILPRPAVTVKPEPEMDTSGKDVEEGNELFIEAITSFASDTSLRYLHRLYFFLHSSGGYWIGTGRYPVTIDHPNQNQKVRRSGKIVHCIVHGANASIFHSHFCPKDVT